MISSPIQLDILIQWEYVVDILRSELELLEISRNQWMRAINLFRVLGGGW